jgi:predicted acyl esterase
VAVGRRLPAFQEWLDHPELDDYWARLVPDTQQYQEITIPVLTITGQYDDDQLGALRYHDEHLSAVTPDDAGRHHVVIGPWDHAGTRTGARSFGGLTFAEASEVDLPALHADWYDWVLGRATKPAFLDRRVVYFHTGEDRWRSSDSIPTGAESLRLYPDQGADLVVDPSLVAEEPPPSDYYTLRWPPPGAAFLSEPLPEALDLTGRFLHGDTSATLLAEALFRARYRSSLTRPTAWPTGTEVDVVITGFPFVSLRTAPGDRIGLVIRPPHLRFQTNFHSGEPVADERPEAARAGQIRLVRHHLTVPRVGNVSGNS